MCELASMASCREEMAAEAEDGVDGFEGGEKVLRLLWVLESLPLSFLESAWADGFLLRFV